MPVDVLAKAAGLMVLMVPFVGGLSLAVAYAVSDGRVPVRVGIAVPPQLLALEGLRSIVFGAAIAFVISPLWVAFMNWRLRQLRQDRALHRHEEKASIRAKLFLASTLVLTLVLLVGFVLALLAGPALLAVGSPVISVLSFGLLMWMWLRGGGSVSNAQLVGLALVMSVSYAVLSGLDERSGTNVEVAFGEESAISSGAYTLIAEDGQWLFLLPCDGGVLIRVRGSDVRSMSYQRTLRLEGPSLADVLVGHRGLDFGFVQRCTGA